MRPKRSVQFGFSIIEAILSISLLALLIMLLFNLYPTSLLGIRRAEHRLLADNLARSLVERERARPFADLTPLPPTNQPSFTNEDGVIFQPVLEIRPVGVSGVTTEVRAMVTWKVQGRTQQVTHAAYVSKVRPE
ncbi:MAG: hypothetical protein AB1758_08565 [Candidatus Eremiobacterota bacterium]